MYTRTAIYCRVSSEGQANRGTIENRVGFGTIVPHRLRIDVWPHADQKATSG